VHPANQRAAASQRIADQIAERLDVTPSHGPKRTPPCDAPRMSVTPRPLPLDALRLARRRFLAAERIDMSALAEELGVNRVTLYRWFGSRDRFLVEVIWSLTEDTLDDIGASTGQAGAERVVAIVVAFLERVIANRGMQRWLAEEGEHAMRLLTRHETDFQPRLIVAIERLLRDEDLELPVDLHELAYVIVRLIESYTYLDLITGERPDASRAEPILRMLLRLETA
jgi:AcrR family transcriptional regulator